MAQKKIKQEGHEALNRSPEYTGQSQTFNFEIWMTFGQVQRMMYTFDTHSTSLTHLAKMLQATLRPKAAIVSKKKFTFSHTKAYVTKFDLDVKYVKVNPRS